MSRRAYDAFLSAKAAVVDVSELPALVSRLHYDFASETVDTVREEGPRLLDDEVSRRSCRIMQNRMNMCATIGFRIALGRVDEFWRGSVFGISAVYQA